MSQSPKILKPMQGIKVWKNPKNKFCVFELHYTADPHKRTEKWYKENRPKYSRAKWNQEYEISWESWAGRPVYQDFRDVIHCVKGEIEPHHGLPLLRGWDFGLTPACVICQMQGEQLMVMREMTAVNMGIERFSDIVLNACSTLFPYWRDNRIDWVDIIDPSGFYRSDTDEKSCATIMNAKGMTVIAGPEAFPIRKESVESFLTRTSRFGPAFQIAEDHCPMLVKGFKGGYQYPDNAEDIENSRLRPKKNKYSHAHDSLQMVAGKVRGHSNIKKVTVARPGYSFTRGT